MKVAIIGSGPASLMCAINCKYETHIFTKDEKLGKKILVTGNGRCNLTNTKINEDSYNQNLSKFFDVFDNKKTIQFFNELGLVTYEDEENRVYPISNSAQSVLDVLQRRIENKNVVLHLECEVEKIEKIEDKFIINNNKLVMFDKVVICSGSSDKLLNQLGIRYKAFTPSLVALKTKENTKRLSGIKLSNISVKMALNNIIKEEYSALPAVTIPSFLKAGFNLAKASKLVSGLKCSSFLKTMGSPLRCGMTTGTTSSSNFPSAQAFAAF